MQIITKSIHIIDYERNSVFIRDTPDTFDSYVSELITYINGNTAVRQFRTRSVDTEVVSCARQIFLHRVDQDVVCKKTDAIAQRLLIKEVEAQRQVARLNTNVQKGSLIQALLYDEDQNIFTYLLAKVEHSEFVDDADFSFKSGFSKDKKKIWKSCLIDLPNFNDDSFCARIYSNTVARYWSNDFLELDEMASDENNTLNAFKSIESTLNRNIKNIAPHDHTVIRNAVISYFKNNEHFDYEEMLGSVLCEDYTPTSLSQDKLTSLRKKLSLLPAQKHFDRQFKSTPSVIDTRIKKVYKVNDGIDLRITAEISDLEGTITAYRDSNGIRFIKIKTNNDLTYKRFALGE